MATTTDYPQPGDALRINNDYFAFIKPTKRLTSIGDMLAGRPGPFVSVWVLSPDADDAAVFYREDEWLPGRADLDRPAVWPSEEA